MEAVGALFPRIPSSVFSLIEVLRDYFSESPKGARQSDSVEATAAENFSDGTTR